MDDDGVPFQGDLFPSSYFVLYCPYECCILDTPFKEAVGLLEHLKSGHKTEIFEAKAVIPFLDRYLGKIKEVYGFDQNPSTESMIIGKDDYEDASIRASLHQHVLAEMLAKQERERHGIHRKGRQCLFCMTYSPTLKELFTHMFKEHHFNIGLLDNLVMVGEFLRDLEELLERNICICCHRVFRSPATLRRHMKNKRHYKIDSKNNHYDKYYIVNYLKGGLALKAPDALIAQSNSPEDDWEELDEEIDRQTMCLFCDEVLPNPGAAFAMHLQEAHNFDWVALRRDLASEDAEYDYIKLVTFLRSKMNQQECPYCQQGFDDETDLHRHLEQERHCKVPDRSVWNRPENMFPLYDDDPLLFDFEDFDA